MQTLTACPSDADLELFLLGRLDDARSVELEDHLESCRACMTRISQINAEDDVVRAMRKDKAPAQISVATDLIPQLKRLAPADETTLLGVVDTDDTSRTQHTPSSVLTATDEPHEIGCLGPYRIHAVIGSGGMGMVFRGLDPRLQRKVAIKVVRPDVLSKPGMQDLLLREAQSAAAVEHDHIVVIHAVETHNGIPCITMPLLQGESLDTRLKSASGPLPLADVLRIGRETASGLAAAHARGLIHRDIKPGNLWLEAPTDRVKILDFGIAVVGSASAEGTAGISGTLGYIAPEAWLGSQVDQRADLFSLGCVLYRMATGLPPFPNHLSVRQLPQAVQFEQPRLACEANPELPGELGTLIDALLARQPADRPQSAADVVTALTNIEQQIQAARDRVIRRRWLGVVAVSAALSAAGVAMWAVFFNAPVKPQLVAITFESDRDLPTVVLSHAGLDQQFDPVKQNKMNLEPGDYHLRLAHPLGGRELMPNHLTVRDLVPETFQLSLVGEVAQQGTHSQSVVGVAAVLLDGRMKIVSAGMDRILSVWEPGSQATPRFVNLSSSARCLALSDDGTIAATAGGNKQAPVELGIHLWDLKTLVPLGDPLLGHQRLITAAAFSPDGRFLATAAANELFLWNLDLRQPRDLARQQGEYIHAVRFMHGGHEVVTGGDHGHVRIWDVQKGKLLGTIPPGPADVRAIATYPRGLITAGEDGIIRIWEGQPIKSRNLPASVQTVAALAVSPDGNRLLSGGDDMLVRVWSIADGRELYVFRGHTKRVTALAFTPDGRNAVSGSADGTVRLWRLPF